MYTRTVRIPKEMHRKPEKTIKNKKQLRKTEDYSPTRVSWGKTVQKIVFGETVKKTVFEKNSPKHKEKQRTTI